jgi:AcrR family transcriptional regulator
MSPKPSVREERTQEIIDAAMKVFAEQGFHAATMDEIADQAGVSKGTLYLYFKGKDKIISSLMQWFFRLEYSLIDKIALEELSARETIEKVTQLVVDDLISMRPFIPVLFEFISLSARNKTVGRVVRESMYGFMDRIEPVFKRGIENGEFKDNLIPHDLVLAYGALIEGTILVWSYDLNNFNFAEALSSSERIFLDGIMSVEK